MAAFDEIKKEPIDTLVTKEAMAQIDELIEKLKIALSLQVKLNQEIYNQKKLEQI